MYVVLLRILHNTKRFTFSGQLTRERKTERSRVHNPVSYYFTLERTKDVFIRGTTEKIQFRTSDFRTEEVLLKESFRSLHDSNPRRNPPKLYGHDLTLRTPTLILMTDVPEGK